MSQTVQLLKTSYLVLRFLFKDATSFYDKDDIRKIQSHNFRKLISEILNPYLKHLLALKTLKERSILQTSHRVPTMRVQPVLIP